MDKETETEARIAGMIEKHAGRGGTAVLWSGGKDSSVMLDLASAYEPAVVTFMEDSHRDRFTFVHELTREWFDELVHYRPPHTASAVYHHPDGKINLVRTYNIGGGKTIALPKEVEEWPGEMRITMDRHCGDAYLREPKGVLEFPWSLVLVGHRADDTDPTIGAVPLQSDTLDLGDGREAFFPLFGWTEDEVVEYAARSAMLDPYRYGGDYGNAFNTDYFQGCTRCLKVPPTESVHCPLTGGEIPGKRGIAPEIASLRMGYFTAPDTKE